MSFGQFLGKAFFCLLLVLSGLGKVQNPSSVSQYMVSQTDAFYKLVDSNPTLKPYNHLWRYDLFIKDNAEMIIRLFGIFELVTTFTFMVNIRYFGLLFAMVMVPVTAIMHNPLTVSKTERSGEIIQVIKNIAFIGICIMLSSVPPSRSKRASVVEGNLYVMNESDKHEQAMKAEKEIKGKDIGKHTKKGDIKKDQFDLMIIIFQNNFLVLRIILIIIGL